MRTLLQRSLTLGLLVLGMFLNASAASYDFEADGIFYSISDEAARFVNVVAGDTKYAGNIVIPATVTNDGVTYTVAGMDKSAFNKCGGLISVTLNDVIRVIPQYAFAECENLEKVVLGSNVEEIGYRAFSDNINLKDINLNDNITSFGAFAFAGCTSLEELRIPAALTDIREYAFEYSPDLKLILAEKGGEAEAYCVSHHITYSYAENE